jgi:hypothetical protein
MNILHKVFRNWGNAGLPKSDKPTSPLPKTKPDEWRQDTERAEQLSRLVRDPLFVHVVGVARAGALDKILHSRNDEQVKRLQVFDQVAGYLEALQTLEDMATPVENKDYELRSTYGISDKLAEFAKNLES